ncbi:MAG TPA: DUF5916 domain-containing protein [Gemmatimonadales bacterium]
MTALPLFALQALQAPQAPDSAALRHSNGLVPPSITAVRVPRPPAFDGRLDDPEWALAAPLTDFRQVDPEEGKPASESTAVRIVYDDAALYIGVRMYDRDPARISRHLGRRDTNTQSDDFRVLIDSYHDHRTAFRFDVNPLGVKNDIQFGDDGNFADNSFDPVWEAATSIDALGWTAEYRIPFSQLRFSRARDQVWGIRLVRTILRKNEFDLFPFVGKTENGFVSRFAHLVGLHDIPAPKRLELLPYTLGRGTFRTPDNPADPFDKARALFGGAGLDLKYGLTSNLTLDATVNPDFGQVELDPAFVNLTAFEQFLPEHRPFFVEGADIFTFGGGTGGFLNFSSAPRFFYSRRIGRPPEGSPYSPGQFVDLPDNTTILGAAKLTGRSPGGWSLGVLDATTGRATATVLDTLSGLRAHDEVGATTNYFAGRARRTLRGGDDSYGFMLTGVNRDLRVPALDFLRSSAYAWGVDGKHRWGHNTYAVAADLAGSYIGGDTTAIQTAQLASSRYFARPDAHAFHYDPRRTSLTGLSGDLYLDKLAGSWLWGAAVSTSSPGFEVNDLGFQRRVDRISGGAYLAHHWTHPGPVIREATAIVTLAPSWNYDGDPIQREVFATAFGTFKNFWFFNVDGGVAARVVDDRLTRGGPDALAPRAWTMDAAVQTDQRKTVTYGAQATYNQTASGGWSANGGVQLGVRPSGALSFSLTPNYSVGRISAQYVTTIADSFATATFGSRYVFAQLDHHELDLTLRMTATVLPTLSLELFTQPFTFSGDYQGLKELAAPRTFRFLRYGQAPGSAIHYDAATATYAAFPDSAAHPADSLVIANPSFRTRSFQVNAVVRWEYRPGSTLFVVWTQSRSRGFADPSFDAGRDFGRELFADRPTNVLLVKLNYWMSL